MQELKRVLIDKRFLIVLLIIFLLNGSLFYQMEVDEEMQELSKMQQCLYQESLLQLGAEKLADYFFQEATDFEQKNDVFTQNVMNTWDGESDILCYMDTLPKDEQTQIRAKLLLSDVFHYLENYSDSVQEILNRAEEQIQMSVFTQDSFARRNIEKTKHDFADILNISVQYGPETAFESIADFNVSDFLIIIPVLVAIVVLLDERKKGLWEFVFATKNGRCRLSFNRILVMATVSFLASGLIYLQNIVMAGICYSGYGNVLRPIQSIQICSKIILPINVLEFFCLSFFLKFIIAFFIGLITSVLMFTLQSSMGVVFFMIICLTAEYQAYSQIPALSRFRIFKYVNIFAWMDSEWCMRTYLNLNVAGYPIEIYDMMTIVALFLLLFVSILFLFTGRLRPFQIRAGIIKHPHQTFLWNKKRYFLSMFRMECQKQFIVQKMWLVTGLAISMAVLWYDDEQIAYDYKGTLYQTYFEQLAGEVTTEKLDYLQQELIIWQTKYEEQERLLAQSVDDISAEKKKDQFLQAIECTQSILEYAEKMSDRREAGEQVELVNQVSYEAYMGNRSLERNQRNILFVLVLVVIFSAVLFSSENTQQTGKMIRSTKYGRGKFVACKYAVLFLELIIVVLPVWLSDYFSIRSKYQLCNQSASIKSLSFAEDFIADIKISTVIFLIFVIRILLFYLVAVFVTLITKRISHVMAAITIGMIVIGLPAALYDIGFDVSWLTVSDELLVMNWIW